MPLNFFPEVFKESSGQINLIDIPKIRQNWGAVYRKQQLIRIHRRFSLFLKANNKANVF